MFSMGHLVQVVDVMMGNLPYILFCPKSETKNMLFYYSGLPTWTMLHVKYKKKMKIIKQEIAVDQFQLRCVMENVPAA